jgi:L-ascorbate metabolism protein UlaG (beta-lactamase superfamily)
LLTFEKTKNMKTQLLVVSSILILNSYVAMAIPAFQTDTIPLKNGNLLITFVGHGSLFLSYNGTIIHIDPVGRFGNYNYFPKADVILVTHHHGDHWDSLAVSEIWKPGTKLIYTSMCATKSTFNGTILKNDESLSIREITIEAVPAYNIVNKRENGQVFHPKGEGNGYVITIDGKRIYIAGDTENIPEMKNLKSIDIAFLPMNLPYTMTPEMVVEAVKLFHPKVLYPYHYGNTDVAVLLSLMKDIKDCEVKIRPMQ